MEKDKESGVSHKNPNLSYGGIRKLKRVYSIKRGFKKVMLRERFKTLDKEKKRRFKKTRFRASEVKTEG